MNQAKLKLHLNVPIYLRVFALAVIAISLILLGYSLYQSRSKPKFAMEGMPTNLSKDIVGVATNYERVEVENNRTKYLIRAGKATSFADNHQELENVYLEVYDEAGNKDVLSADYAVYIPTEGKNFKVFFFGSVKIEAKDGSVIKAEKLSYDKASEEVETEGETEFSRNEIKGRADKAKVSIATGQAELFQNVRINFERPNGEKGEINANYAKLKRDENRIDFEGNVFAKVESAQPFELRSQKLVCFFDEDKLKSVELIENAEIFQKSTQTEKRDVKATAARIYAELDGDLKKVKLQTDAQVETTESGQNPIFSKADSIIYDKAAGKLLLERNSEIKQSRANEEIYIKGDRVEAYFFADGQIRNAVAEGNAYLKQITSERTVESSAGRMSVFYAENRKIKNAEAVERANIVVTPSDSKENYSKATVFAPKAVKFSFNNDLLQLIQTEGRTTLFLAAAQDKPNSANRSLTADKIKTFLRPNGKDFSRAEATGNVVIQIEPVQKSSENYKTTITAEQVDCDFYEGNNLKSCIVTRNAKATQEFFSANAKPRTLTTERFSIEFDQSSQQAQKYEAVGKARYSEGDRNAIANQIVFTEPDRIVRLRGGEPTIWDAKARAKAGEIDWDTRNERSFLRQKVSTTYYNQKQSDGTLPFSDSSAPVYITAETAEFDHRNEVGIYYGNVRAWQENNYIRSEKLVLQAKDKKMNGEGKVQTLLYKVKQRIADREVNQPVFATSDKISYSDDTKMIRYEGNVDIRQGSDRITSDVADVFLNERNELIKAIVNGQVRITQPNRRATGDYAEYVAANEMIVLRGKPATVEDAEQGELQGGQMTLYLRENRFTSEGKTKPEMPAGRTRSVYKVKNQ